MARWKIATPAPIVVLALSQLPTIGGSAWGTSLCSWYNAAFGDIVVDAAELGWWGFGRRKSDFMGESDNMS